MPNSSVVEGSKAASVASYVLIGKIITLIMAGIAFLIVTRLLGPTQYGIYTLAIAFGGIFGTIGYLGIGTALQKFIPEYMQKNQKREIGMVISSSMFIIVVSMLVIGGACILFSGMISQYVFHTYTMSLLIKVVVLEIVMVTFFGAFYDMFVGFGSGKYLSIIVILEAVFQGSVSILLAILGFGALAPLIGLIAGYSAGFVAGFYLLLRYNKVKLTPPSPEFIKKILYFTAPLAASNILGSLGGSAAIIFVGYYVAADVIGNIGVTAQIGGMLGIVFSSMTASLLPAFSSALASKKLSRNIGSIYSYSVYIAIALVGPVLFYMVVFSTPFANTLLGAVYTNAPLYISILSIGTLLGVAGSYASTLLISASRVGLVLKYNTLTSLAILLLVFGLVPFLGSIAYVILVFLISPVLTDILFIRRLSAMFKINLKPGKLIRLVIADAIISAVALPLYLFFGGIPLLIIAGILFLILYPPLCVLIGGADKADLDTITALSKEIPLVGGVLRLFIRYAGLVV